MFIYECQKLNENYKGFYSLYLWFAPVNLTITWFYHRCRFSYNTLRVILFVSLSIYLSLSKSSPLTANLLTFSSLLYSKIHHINLKIFNLCLKRVKTEWCINLLCPPNTLSHTYVNASTKRNGNHKCVHFLGNLFFYFFFTQVADKVHIPASTNNT